ncbi:hypothetical protein DXV75_09345 [Alteromonas aestuariivivens]|uniref:PKD/Chitinase domain-containing protein n=1 Tax=Alteromonas aestuariivivens TaxID=1938339 RepID=A0A3D8M7G8_9ALTE|nr:PKD domain-containing protein [Alteromonas aestuariivivens]RDV25494.1 hypothetical protein DXV75_09345 [Alteromonas aestuariivivens]
MKAYSAAFRIFFIFLLSLCLVACDHDDKEPENSPPLASAGNDFSVDEQTLVTLTGQGTDEDGSVTTYMWQQVSGDAVTLSSTDTAVTEFIAPEVDSDAELSFELTVEDDEGASHSDIVVITVNNVNRPPLADAGSDSEVVSGQQVQLDGSGSLDDDGTISSYAWSQTSGETVMLTDANSHTAVFTAPEVTAQTEFMFSLTITDNDGDTSTDSTLVTVVPANQAPVASAGEDITVDTGTTVTLDGNASSDSDGDALFYLWTLAAPEGSSASLNDATSAQPEFVADIAGDYLVSLVVNDGVTDSSADSLTVTATDAEEQMTTTRINGVIYGFDLNGELQSLSPENVSITLNLVDANGEVIASAAGLAAENPDAGEELRFSNQIEGADAARVTIHVEHAGYTTVSRSVAPGPLVNIEAKLQQIAQQEVLETTEQSVSGRTVTGFNLSFEEDNNGSTETTMRISVPSSLLPPGTASLNMAVETYDPNDPEQAEFFPGEYEDSSGQSLVSVAFNFAEITTQDNLPISDAIARLQPLYATPLIANADSAGDEAEPVVINRTIPSSSCSILETMGDSDPDTDGFQIPVYTYNPNTGVWDLLGQGTLYDSAGNAVADNLGEFGCGENLYILEILVSNEIFLSKWWNLDYPLVFSEPREYCAIVEVSNEEGQQVSGVLGYVTNADGSVNFSRNYLLTDGDGRSEVCVTQSDAGEEINAKVVFYNMTDFGVIQYSITLYREGSGEVQVVVLNRPQLCFVDGKTVFSDDRAAGRQLMYAYTVGYLGINNYNFAVSDESGNYSLSLQCGIEYYLFNYTGYLLAVYNGSGVDLDDFFKELAIDGGVDPDEVSDDGDVVVMQDFSQSYQPPIAQIFGVSSLDQISGVVYGFVDAFPMELKITVRNEDRTTVYDTLTQVVALSDDEEEEVWFLGGSSLSIPYEFPDTNEAIFADLVIVDAYGNTWTLRSVRFY